MSHADLKKKAYLDQNTVIDLKLRCYPQDNKALESLVRSRELRCVISPWHWVEAARASNEAIARSTAQFFDSLQANWLRERTRIQEREIRAYLSGRAGDVGLIDPICATVSEAGSELSGLRGAAVIMTSPELVSALRTQPVALQNLTSAYQSNKADFAKNVQRMKAGQLPPDHAWRLYLRGLGKTLGFSSYLDALEQADTSSFRSITSEFEIAVENWRRASNDQNMQLSPQRLGDVFHLAVALPYVDYVVSRDSSLRGLIGCVRSNLPFSTAEPVESLTELLHVRSAVGRDGP